MAFYSLGPVSFESVSAVTATPSVELGTRVNVAGNEYVYVYNASNSNLPVGYGCITSGCSGFSITLSSVASQMAGVFGVVKHGTISTGYYGWILSKGFCKVATTNGLAVGDAFAIGADGVFENKSGLTGSAQGKALSACASGTATGPAYFCCV